MGDRPTHPERLRIHRALEVVDHAVECDALQLRELALLIRVEVRLCTHHRLNPEYTVQQYTFY